jgi:4-hydroxybenzoyl-CoA reductase subunit beta
MKRRQQTPGTVVALRGIAALRDRSVDPERGLTLGALTHLSALEHDPAIAAPWPALARAASLVATPPIRNMGTVGGNLCLDTRCSYYDQSHEWRAAIGYCMKRQGDTCWVAPGSDRGAGRCRRRTPRPCCARSAPRSCWCRRPASAGSRRRSCSPTTASST